VLPEARCPNHGAGSSPAVDEVRGATAPAVVYVGKRA
jgi:hypothetical protein